MGRDGFRVGQGARPGARARAVGPATCGAASLPGAGKGSRAVCGRLPMQVPFFAGSWVRAGVRGARWGREGACSALAPASPPSLPDPDWRGAPIRRCRCVIEASKIQHVAWQQGPALPLTAMDADGPANERACLRGPTIPNHALAQSRPPRRTSPSRRRTSVPGHAQWPQPPPRARRPRRGSAWGETMETRAGSARWIPGVCPNT
jgi:hypothetical protein